LRLKLFEAFFSSVYGARSLRFEVHDEYLSVAASGGFLRGVMQIDRFDPKSCKQRSNLRYVIQRQNEFSPDVAKALCQNSEIIFVEVVPVELAPEVRRIKIEERVGTIKSLEDLLIGKTFDLNPFQSFMGIFKELREFFEIESRPLDHVPMIVGMSHETRKRILENIEVPSRPLNVRESRWICCLQQVEQLTAHEGKTEISDEFLVMRLAHAEQVHELSVQVVQDFDGRGPFTEEHLGSACECLNVRLVLRKYLNDRLCETVFPSYV
jgi:hypothetical protein